MKSIVPWFCLVAFANSSVAFANEGLDAYRQGHYNDAANLLTDASNHDPVVDYYIGLMRLYGYGHLKDNATALRYFKQAADKGYLPAENIMARYALLVDNKPEDAINWFKKAADANDVAAQMYCASAYLFGVGVKKNPDLAKKYYIAAARNGNSIAQYTLAASFLETHQSANKKLGLIWLNKSVAQNNPEAQLMLAELYATGTLVERDFAKAKELAHLALAQGYLPAQYQLGQIALLENNPIDAKEWFTKAAEAHFEPAEFALSKLYLDPKSSLYDAHTGFLWMLKSAQNGSAEAQAQLALMYKNGQGTEIDEAMATEWQKKAAETAKNSLQNAQINAVHWLTNGKKSTFAETKYRLYGILGAWQNPSVLKENNYNQPPQMEVVGRETLYKPKFVMMSPNQIPISEYYDALVLSLNDKQVKPFVFPHYSIKAQLPASQETANASSNGEDYDYLQHLMPVGEQKTVSYQSAFKKLEGQAILGDSTAQFDVGQMYQYGLGVEKNVAEAIKYYQLAASQQDLPSEYNLALLYLQGEGVTADYKLGMDWLNDAAFKGNSYAQYVLAHIYEQGFNNAAGEQVIAPEHDQAMAMYNLAAANNYGLAQYRLAELMVRDAQGDMSSQGKAKRSKLIKNLYQNAVNNGVVEATLPLAFYNAMDPSPEKQTLAFEAAKKTAADGNPDASLLLGLMYDRGIAVEKNQNEALKWYQQASINPVSAFVLGTYYSDGIGISKDREKGQELLQKSAEAGFPYAYLNLGVLKQRNNEAFLPDLNKALELGNSTAGLLLADYYLSLAKDNEQMKQARDIYQHFAEKGDKDGQLKLGFLLENGLGGPIDLPNAQKWYALAAAQNQPIAQYFLAKLYQLGKIDKEPNYVDAKKWYTAAAGTYSPAAVGLGFIYDTVDDNYQQAIKNYQQAANSGDPIAQLDLGLIYEKGKGTAVDFVKAATLYQQAAAQGISPAMVQLAGLYLNGQGVSRDTDIAMSWYKKAAELGDRDALYQLGMLFETGVATKLDYPEALSYYKKAAEKGNAKAIVAVERMNRYGQGGALTKEAKDNKQALNL